MGSQRAPDFGHYREATLSPLAAISAYTVLVGLHYREATPSPLAGTTAYTVFVGLHYIIGRQPPLWAYIIGRQYFCRPHSVMHIIGRPHCREATLSSWPGLPWLFFGNVIKLNASIWVIALQHLQFRNIWEAVLPIYIELFLKQMTAARRPVTTTFWNYQLFIRLFPEKHFEWCQSYWCQLSMNTINMSYVCNRMKIA